MTGHNLDERVAMPRHALTPRHTMALACATAGIPVFPCAVNGKQPAISRDRGGRGFKDATTNIDQINQWWAEADYNLAIEPERAGWAVVDIDPQHGGDTTWTAFVADISIPATRTVMTPSGGRHLYFKGSLPPTRAGVLGKGVDTRGRGGYVLVPPSVINGVEYSSDGATIADLPERIIALATHKEHAPRAAQEGVTLDMPENVWRAEQWLAAQPVPPDGGGEANDTLYRYANRLKDYGLSEERAREMLEKHTGYGRMEETVHSAYKNGQNEPGSHATTYGVESVTVAEPPPPPGEEWPEGDDEVELICAADVEPEEYTWLMPEHYACGAFHILAGKPEVGKNLITTSIAAALTTGGTLPDGTRAPLGDVLIWSSEEDFEKTTLPRFLAAGGDRSRFFRVGDIKAADGKRRPFDPARDVGRLCAAMRKRPELRYVIIDPVSVVVAGGRGASNNNAESRRALQPLVDLAKERNVVVEGITHFTKDSGRRDVLERIIESTAFTAVARIVHIVAKFEDESRARRWVRVKGNIVNPVGPVGYEYEPVDAEVPGYAMRRPKLAWGDPLRGSPRALIAEDIEPGAKDRAKAFLVMILQKAGGAMLVTAIRQAAAANSHNWRSIERAKEDLGGRVVSRQNLGDQHAGWMWELNEPKNPYTDPASQNW